MHYIVLKIYMKFNASFIKPFQHIILIHILTNTAIQFENIHYGTNHFHN